MRSVVAVFSLSGMVAEALGCLLTNAGGFRVAACQSHFGTVRNILAEHPGCVCVVTDELVDPGSMVVIQQLRRETQARFVLVSFSGNSAFAGEFDALVDARLGASALVSTVRGLLQADSNMSTWQQTERPPARFTTKKLSAKEREAADLVTKGYSNRKIAAVMGVSEDSVKNYIRSLMQKFNCENRVQVALVFLDAAEPAS
jgi:DNA-binding NarL/FixJ family response regulator